MLTENPTIALAKTAQSPTLARVSSQLALTDKLLTKPEEPFLIPYRKGDKWGFCDRNKNIVIDCVYDRTYPFYQGLACIELECQMGFINESGQIVIDVCYDLGIKVLFSTSDTILDSRLHHSGIFFSEGVAFVKKDNKFGFINRRGDVIIPHKYDDANPFSEGLASVELNGKWGFISKSGAEVIPFQYSSSRSFSNGLAVVGSPIGFSHEIGKEVY